MCSWIATLVLALDVAVLSEALARVPLVYSDNPTLNVHGVPNVVSISPQGITPQTLQPPFNEEQLELLTRALHPAPSQFNWQPSANLGGSSALFSEAGFRPTSERVFSGNQNAGYNPQWVLNSRQMYPAATAIPSNLVLAELASERVQSGSPASHSYTSSGRAFVTDTAHATNEANNLDATVDSAHGSHTKTSGKRGNTTAREINSGEQVFGAILFLLVICMLCTRGFMFKHHPPEQEFKSLPSVLAKQEDKVSDELNSEYVPNGNIFRYLALDTECRKHREDLHNQLKVIADRFQTVLNGVPFEEDDRTPRIANDAERRCAKLVVLLEEKSKSTGVPDTYAAVYEILGPIPPRRAIFGLFLVPGDTAERQSWFKNVFMATVVAAVMVIGPVLINYSSWVSDDNPVRDGIHISWAEALTTGSVEALGTLFLILIFEYTRQYASGELTAADMMKQIPSDRYWLRVGQFANWVCIFATCFAMPLIFFGELMAKDIVYDSMSMLFIFTLDDLSGDILGYLNVDDKDFRQKTVDMMRQLQQTPVELSDIINIDAQDPGDIWDIKLGEEGVPLLGEHLAVTRMYENEDTHGGDGHKVFYTISKGRTTLLGAPSFKTVRYLWVALYYVLTAGEVVVPIIFMCVG